MRLMTTNRLIRGMIWLSRIGCCRGFGIQSPWAYSLVRYVINEHYPYYAYERLAKDFPEADAVRRKMGEFFLRLANHAQPEMVVAVGFDDEDMKRDKAYFRAGCNSLRWTCIGPCDADPALETLGNAPGAHILHANAPAIDAEWLTEAVKRLRTGDFVVVDRLNYNKAVWQDVVGRLQNIVSFDMYYCGLVYVDPKRYKQNYKINF